jgi:DNA polymerase-3 subunit epsilon
MKIVYFDTETTGLPKTRESATRRPDNWPHIVSIAWITDCDGVKTENYYVIKPKWIIPEDSIHVHKITQEIAETTGSDLSWVIDKFLSEDADVLVAHNMNYDFNVLVNAILWDCKMSYPKIPKLICTMVAGTNVCRIPTSYSKNKYKSPKLAELYEHVLKRAPVLTLHNALSDTQILVEIVEACPIIQNIIGLPKADQVITENVNIKTKRPRTLSV